MDRYLLDTGVIIALARKQLVLPAGDHAMAAVSVAELVDGTESANTAEERRRFQQQADLAMAFFPREPYTEEVQVLQGKLTAFSKKSGHTRGDHDLMIAATAAATGRTLLTRDKKARFGDLPGVTVIEL